jgi:hypothetical protein
MKTNKKQKASKQTNKKMCWLVSVLSKGRGRSIQPEAGAKPWEEGF